jgi:hypothetical protein
MADIFDKMEKIDPLAHELGEGLVTNDSRAIESIADKWGWDVVRDEARYNQEHPGEGLAKASISAGAIMAPQAAGSLWGAAAPTAYGAATGTAGEQAAMLAAQTADFGAYGLGKTMGAAAYAGGPGSSAMNAGAGLLAGGGGKGSGGQLAQKMAMNMMNPQQPQQPMPAPRAPQAPAEPLPSPYGHNPESIDPRFLTEEQKRRLRAMGRLK